MLAYACLPSALQAVCTSVHGLDPGCDEPSRKQGVQPLTCDAMPITLDATRLHKHTVRDLDQCFLSTACLPVSYALRLCSLRERASPSADACPCMHTYLSFVNFSSNTGVSRQMYLFNRICRIFVMNCDIDESTMSSWSRKTCLSISRDADPHMFNIHHCHQYCQSLNRQCTTGRLLRAQGLVSTSSRPGSCHSSTHGLVKARNADHRHQKPRGARSSHAGQAYAS